MTAISTAPAATREALGRTLVKLRQDGLDIGRVVGVLVGGADVDAQQPFDVVAPEPHVQCGVAQDSLDRIVVHTRFVGDHVNAMRVEVGAVAQEGFLCQQIVQPVDHVTRVKPQLGLEVSVTDENDVEPV